MAAKFSGKLRSLEGGLVSVPGNYVPLLQKKQRGQLRLPPVALPAPDKARLKARRRSEWKEVKPESKEPPVGRRGGLAPVPSPTSREDGRRCPRPLPRPGRRRRFAALRGAEGRAGTDGDGRPVAGAAPLHRDPDARAAASLRGGFPRPPRLVPLLHPLFELLLPRLHGTRLFHQGQRSQSDW